MIMMIRSWRVFSSYCHIKRSLSLGGAKNSCGCAPKKLIMELCRTGELEEILSRLHHYLVTTTQGWSSMEWLYSFGSSCQLSGIQQGMALDVLYRVPTPKAQLTPEAGDGGWDLTKFYPLLLQYLPRSLFRDLGQIFKYFQPHSIPCFDQKTYLHKWAKSVHTWLLFLLWHIL